MEPSIQTISRWVENNTYVVDDADRFVARCIDGRYPHGDHVAPLAYPGADIGQLLVIVAAARAYGFEVRPGEVFDVLKQLEGGVSRVHDHTDEMHQRDYCAGCGHVQLVQKYPARYGLEPADAAATIDVFAHKVHPEVLFGSHHESAVLVVKGSEQWSVYSQDKAMSVFMVHQALVNARHRRLAELLIESGAVHVLPEQSMMSVETLYEYLSATFDEHLIATSSQLAVGLPQYIATFDDGGGVVVSDGGVVEPFTDTL